MNRTKRLTLMLIGLWLFPISIFAEEDFQSPQPIPIPQVTPPQLPPPGAVPDFEEEDDLSGSDLGFTPPTQPLVPNNGEAPPISPREERPPIPVTPPTRAERFNSPSGPGNRAKFAKPATPPTPTKTNKTLPEYLDLDPKSKTLVVKSFDLQDRDIKDVVTLISKWTGKNFILDSKVRGKITILGPSEVTLQEAYQAFLAALNANDLTTVQNGKFIRIIATAEARRSPVKTYTGSYAPSDENYITRIFQLRYINADEVQREFRDMVTRQGKLFAYEPTNSIIITDTGSNIKRIQEILDALDVKSFETTLHVLPIKNGSSKSIADMLDDIYGEGGGSGASAARRSTFRRTKLERTRGGGIISKIIPDEQTNSLVVLANRAGIVQLRKLVDKLDIKGGESGKIHVYYCEYAKAEDLAETLAALSSGSSRSASSPTSNRRSLTDTSNRNTPGTQRTTTASTSRGPVTADLDGGTKITSDSGTNSLVIIANASDYATIRNVLKKLDIPRLQVLIETAVLEMGVDDSTNVGVNLAASSAVNPFAGGSITDTKTLTAYGKYLVGADAPPGGLTIPFKGSLESLKKNGIVGYAGLLNFLTSNTHTSVLSTPQIVAMDNEQAQLRVIDDIPVVSSFTQGTATAQAQNNIERKEVGIDIKLTPNINAKSRTVRLDIEQKVSNVKNSPTEVSKLSNITTTSRETNTKIVVKDNEFLLLGGLMSDRISDLETKVPLLGDIPILGWLFKSNNQVTTKTNLIILLHPRIIDTAIGSAEIIKEKLDERDKVIEEQFSGKDRFPKDAEKLKAAIEAQRTGPETRPAIKRENDEVERSTEPSTIGTLDDSEEEAAEKPPAPVETKAPAPAQDQLPLFSEDQFEAADPNAGGAENFFAAPQDGIGE